MNIDHTCDYIIIGAGIFGLYATKLLSEKGYKVCVLEKESEAFQRASYVNQARVHQGYHYPRSYSTAIKTAEYFEKFSEHFDFAVNDSFRKIYATSSSYSYTNAEQFSDFCSYADIPCKEIRPDEYFKAGVVDGVFETKEYAFDAEKIKKYFISKINKNDTSKIFYDSEVDQAKEVSANYILSTSNGQSFSAPKVLNTTYASVNQLIDKFGFEKFDIKYEICEVILCDVSKKLEDVGITVMDGPFFSVMPFGLQGFHSLTAVEFTPHLTFKENLPTFDCQKRRDDCTPLRLQDCNKCPQKPDSAWDSMSALSRKFLSSEIKLTYKDSLFAIKPILAKAELDDSRPTVIKKHSEDPDFISVLSGKISTIYDLEDVLP